MAFPRSQKMVVQFQHEATDRILNALIDNALKASGISLGEKDRLNFNIDQFGKITVEGDDNAFGGRKQLLENILNSDDAIRANLFRYQTQKDYIAAGPLGQNHALNDRMISRASDWAHGNLTGILSDEYNPDFGFKRVGSCPWTNDYISQHFPLEFSFQDGKIFQGDTFPEDRVFSNRLDSLANLGKIIGLDESATDDIQSFITVLEWNIASDSSKLTRLLNAALDRAGLGDVNKKITFSQDADGRIVIEGNIPDRQKERLTRIINNDSELSELIKTQSAKQAVLDELKASITDDPVNYNFPSAWKRHNFLPAGFDLSKDSLASAREQLLKNFLDSKDISISDLKGNPDAVFAKYEELGTIKGLRNEIANLIALEQKAAQSISTSAEPLPLLAMKRGELVELTCTNGIDDMVADIKRHINLWINEYNRGYGILNIFRVARDPGQAIIDYTLRFDESGQVSLEVKTEDGESHSEEAAKQFLKTHFIRPDIFRELGSAIMDVHDDEYGNVHEYRHSVVIESGVSGYRVESPEADRAALQEMKELMSDIGSALGNLFRGMSIDNPFSLIFGKDGLLSLDGNSLSVIESQNVRQMMEQINRFLTAEHEGGDTEGLLSDRPSGIAEKLLALKELQDRIHDKSLLPKEGIRFTF